ncbi:hypothetical protein AALC75_08415 [Lachnospiraceae bacterium 48-42]
MWKLDFFILPSKDYKDINEEDIFEFGEKAEYLNRTEKFYIPTEFYYISDKNNITALDFLNENDQNDLSDYFLEIISKQRTCQDTYIDIERKKEYGYLPICENDITEIITQICVKNVKDTEEEKYLRVNDIIRIKRYYLKKVDNYKRFEDRVRDCFPNLVFHNDAFKYIEKLGKYSEVAEELVRHLAILNDVGQRLFYYHNKNEKDTLDELKSRYDIVCSGKGSKEEKSYNKDMFYNGRKFQLTCNPHTKFYREGTSQRIYFCWGRDEIESHSIIIVRIGDHWKK